MAQRSKKTSRRQAEARRRARDLNTAKQQKYTGPWKRRDRRRQALQVAKSRARIVRAYRAARAAGLSEAQAAAQTAIRFGCSVSSVRNYDRMWRQHGIAGLRPVVSTRTYPPKTPWEVIQIILLLRRLLHWGGDRIAAELKSRGLYHISGQGVYNLFKRYRVYTRTYHPVGVRKGIAYGRGEAKAVNDIWHLDFAGPFVTEDGQKCWVLLAVDAYSRLLVTLTVVTSLEAQPVCDLLSDLFREYGTPKWIVTDNGRTFTSAWEDGDHVFSDFLQRHGVAHHRIPPYYPEANGKAEAAVKIVKREALKPFFQANSGWTIGQLEHLLARFHTYYNCHRLHGGIGWQTPTQRWLTLGDSPPTGLNNLFFVEEPNLHFEFC
jgi:transposase InsO family protein